MPDSKDSLAASGKPSTQPRTGIVRKAAAIALWSILALSLPGVISSLRGPLIFPVQLLGQLLVSAAVFLWGRYLWRSQGSR